MDLQTIANPSLHMKIPWYRLGFKLVCTWHTYHNTWVLHLRHSHVQFSTADLLSLLMMPFVWLDIHVQALSHFQHATLKNGRSLGMGLHVPSKLTLLSCKVIANCCTHTEFENTHVKVIMHCHLTTHSKILISTSAIWTRLIAQYQMCAYALTFDIYTVSVGWY